MNKRAGTAFMDKVVKMNNWKVKAVFLNFISLLHGYTASRVAKRGSGLELISFCTDFIDCFTCSPGNDIRSQ